MYVKAPHAGTSAFAQSIIYMTEWRSENMKYTLKLFTYSFFERKDVNLILRHFKKISKGFKKIALFIKTLFPTSVH